ncbi:MAG: M81 family metallopeptidase [Bryobacteraceae bacterium]
MNPGVIPGLALATLLAPDSPPLIAVGGISHETNSFNPSLTLLAEFDRRTPTEAELDQRTSGHDTVAGIVAGARKYGLRLYPTLFAGATPKGPVSAEVFETLTGELVGRIRAAPKLDGVILDLHGAMVSERYPHADAEIVRRVREAVGPRVPIVVIHDFHANISQEIVGFCDALLTYKENPHTDTRERGEQAARIMAAAATGRARPVQALVKPPMIYNIVSQNTRRPPLAPIVAESRRLEQNPKILAASVAGGYPYADVEAMGPAAVVVADGDPELARREAQRLADLLWSTRHQLVLELPDAAQAVRQAMAAPSGPVVLMDLGDNIGGGSAGDSTFLLKELLAQGARGWVMTVYDPQAVQAAVRAGVGGTFDQEVGGKTDRFHGEPIRVRGRVKSLHDGFYFEPQVRHGGARYFDQGLTAVIAVEESVRERPSLLVLTSRRSSPNSLHQLISLGIDPERHSILVAKGAIAPRAAYEPIAKRIIEVDTPGLTSVNPARFTYQRARRTLFGLERTR